MSGSSCLRQWGLLFVEVGVLGQLDVRRRSVRAGKGLFRVSGFCNFRVFYRDGRGAAHQGLEFGVQGLGFRVLPICYIHCLLWRLPSSDP